MPSMREASDHVLPHGGVRAHIRQDLTLSLQWLGRRRTTGAILAEGFSPVSGGKRRRREPEYKAFGWLVSIKDGLLQVCLVLKKIGLGICSISVKKREEMQVEMGSNKTVIKCKKGSP